MNNILVDTGFWFALYNERDTYYKKANELLDYLSLGNIIIPYPCLYETINTRFARNSNSLSDFKRLIEKNRITLLEDNQYKSEALDLTFNSSILLFKPYSLVDMVIRLILEDTNLKINYLITFNPEDFIDVCCKRRIEILYT